MPKDSLDWMAVGLLLFIFGGIAGAFFLYLRTAYRKGGWRRMRTDLKIALVALLMFAAIRILENLGIQRFRDAAGHWFR
jgi:hypothetical protein